MEPRVASLVEERGRLFAALSDHPGPARVSVGRELPARAGRRRRARRLWERLVERGVLVRDFSRWPRVEGCLRVTVGTPAENDAFLAALEDGAPEE